MLIILVIVISGAGYYFYSNSGPGLRRKSRGLIYDDQVMDMCVSGGYQGFPSEEDCENAAMCISTEFSELIKEEDLKRVIGELRENDFEAVLNEYFEERSGLEYSELYNLVLDCLNQNGFKTPAQVIA